MQLHRPTAQLCASAPLGTTPRPCSTKPLCFCSSFSSGLRPLLPAAAQTAPRPSPPGRPNNPFYLALRQQVRVPYTPCGPDLAQPPNRPRRHRGMLRCERDPQNGTTCTHPAHGPVGGRKGGLRRGRGRETGGQRARQRDTRMNVAAPLMNRGLYSLKNCFVNFGLPSRPTGFVEPGLPRAGTAERTNDDDDVRPPRAMHRRISTGFCSSFAGDAATRLAAWTGVDGSHALGNANRFGG